MGKYLASESSESQQHRPPWWLVVAAVLALVWFGTQIVVNITDSMTAIFGSPHHQAEPPIR